MWVRSQDKTRLLKANYIRKNGSFIEAVHSEMGCTLMGKYSTEEKALKVLNAIQESIDKKYYGVFQMPQDDEVE